LQITDYQKHEAFPLVKYIRRYVQNGPMIIMVLLNVNRSIFGQKYTREMIFYIFVSSDLDLWPLKLKFAPLVALVHKHVHAELEVSTAFMFWEN